MSDEKWKANEAAAQKRLLDAQPGDYWRQAADLTIYEAAFWMQVETDPHAHAYRCAHDTDSTYRDYFDDRNVTEAIHDKCAVVISAIRAGQINLSGETYHLNQEMDFSKTHLLKDSWLKWCLEGEYPHIAALFKFKVSSAPVVAVEAGGIKIAQGGITPKKVLPWWQQDYDISLQAQNAGDSLRRQNKPTSNRAIGDKIALHIEGEELRGKKRKVPSGGTIRNFLSEIKWEYAAD